MIRVIGKIIVLKQKKCIVKNRREWVRKLIQRKDQFGVSKPVVIDFIILLISWLYIQRILLILSHSSFFVENNNNWENITLSRTTTSTTSVCGM
jgi:hypothetical protein